MTQSAVAAAIYTSCGRIGLPLSQTPPPIPIFLKRFPPPLLAIPFAGFANASARNQKTHKKTILSQSTVRARFISFFFLLFFSIFLFLMLLFSLPQCVDASAFARQPSTARVTVRESKPMHLFQFSHSIDSPSEIYVAFSSGRTPHRVGPLPTPPTTVGVTVTREAPLQTPSDSSPMHLFRVLKPHPSPGMWRNHVAEKEKKGKNRTTRSRLNFGDSFFFSSY